MKYAFILTFFTLVSSWGQSNHEMFAQANQFYNEEKYPQAIDNYLRILNTKNASAALYYNLANAYYKANDVANSIYYYEKALILSPDDTQIKHNLKFAQQMVVDEITPMPEFWTDKIIKKLGRWNSSNAWGIWSIVFMVAFAASFLTYYFSQKSSVKRLFFTMMFVFIFASGSSLWVANIVQNHLEKQKYGILFKKEVAFLEKPDLESKENFTLHEGMKVKVISSKDDWYKLQIADGREGWVKKSSVRIL